MSLSHKLTSREYVVSDLDILVPAFSRNARLPNLDKWRALTPSKCHGNTQREVYRNYNEPHQHLDPARGDTQDRDRKRGFAPQCRKYGKGARQINK